VVGTNPKNPVLACYKLSCNDLSACLPDCPPPSSTGGMPPLDFTALKLKASSKSNTHRASKLYHRNRAACDNPSGLSGEKTAIHPSFKPVGYHVRARQHVAILARAAHASTHAHL